MKAGIRFSLCHLRANTPWEGFPSPEVVPTLCQTRLILRTPLLDCSWELSNKTNCKTHSLCKKCYEGYEILTNGSVRWVMVGRFKRKR